MGRRHPHVDDRNIGLVLFDRLQELLRVADGGDHVEAPVGQELGQAGPQQDRVFGDHDAHGSSAVMVVGPPTGLSTVNTPWTAAARWARPRRPVPWSPACSRPIVAPPRPLSVIVMRRRSPVRMTVTSALVAWACFAMLVSASEARK